jgi:hypothetical protein
VFSIPGGQKYGRIVLTAIDSPSTTTLGRNIRITGTLEHDDPPAFPQYTLTVDFSTDGINWSGAQTFPNQNSGILSTTDFPVIYPPGGARFYRATVTAANFEAEAGVIASGSTATWDAVSLSYDSAQTNQVFLLTSYYWLVGFGYNYTSNLSGVSAQMRLEKQDGFTWVTLATGTRNISALSTSPAIGDLFTTNLIGEFDPTQSITVRLVIESIDGSTALVSQLGVGPSGTINTTEEVGGSWSIV